LPTIITQFYVPFAIYQFIMASPTGNMMSCDFTHKLPLINERLESGVKWLERPVLSRSPTPIMVRLSLAPSITEIQAVWDKIDLPIMKNPGDLYPVKYGNEKVWRMVPKQQLLGARWKGSAA
jgi:hypothetical protein